MNCSVFESKLGEFQNELLTAPEMRAAQSHVDSCSRCQTLLQISRGDLNYLSDDKGKILLNSIMRRTSGAACGRAREHICEFIDGTLNPDKASVLASHLQYCTACRNLAASIEELSRTLPAMAALNPGPSLLPAILQAARATAKRASPLDASLYEFWSKLIRRPHLTWEAAYAGTLLFALLVGNPVASLGSASISAIHQARLKSGAAWQTALHSVPSNWTGGGAEMIRKAGEKTSVIITYKQQLPNSLSKLEQTGQTFLKSADDWRKWAYDLLLKACSDFFKAAGGFLKSPRPR